MNVAKVKNLKNVFEKIDDMQTIGLTGFVEPLKQVADLVARLPKENVKEMFFLTDGYDNQWSEKEILKECEKLAGVVDHSYLVEYGWYCNRPLIEKMAEILQATHLFSEDYESYELLAEKAISEILTKKVRVKVNGKPHNNSVFFYHYDNVNIAKLDEEGYVLLPEDLAAYSFVEEGSQAETLEATQENYLALYAAASARDSSMVYALLKKLGDVKLIKMYVNAYSKQDLTKFLDEVGLGVADSANRMTQGCDYNLVPREDAYNVLEMLEDLMKEGNKLYPDHPAFQYKRIGRATEKVSVAERIEKAKEAMTSSTDLEQLKKDTEKMMNLLNSGDLEFKAKTVDSGIDISRLTWNEDRPNVSILIRREGTVDLPKNKFGIETLDSFIYRNYTIIKDGILNMNVLPVSLSKATFEKLQENGLLSGETFDEKKVYELDFSPLPVINRKMVKSVSAVEIFSKQLDLETLKGKAKVFKYYLNELQPKTSVNWKNQYGEEAVSWLAEQGLTEYNGFSPKVKSVESTDFYIGKQLSIKIKGLSALPKVSEVEEKVTKGGKLTIKDLAMAQAIKEYATVKGSSEAERITFLEKQLESIKTQEKQIMLEMSKVKFSTIIGQVWFKEFDDVDADSSMEMDYLGLKATISAEMKDIEVKI